MRNKQLQERWGRAPRDALTWLFWTIMILWPFLPQYKHSLSCIQHFFFFKSKILIHIASICMSFTSKCKLKPLTHIDEAWSFAILMESMRLHLGVGKWWKQILCIVPQVLVELAHQGCFIPTYVKCELSTIMIVNKIYKSSKKIAIFLKIFYRKLGHG